MEEEGEYGCWMWRKRKNYCLSSINFNVASPPTTRPTPIFDSFYDHPHHHHQDHVGSSSSWEEQAFAADHQQVGHVNNGVGCIWPPPSYSCTFCNREFKSAQALGGHMNVHRRDRARLKQPPNTIIHNHNNIIIHQRVLEEESESSKGKGTTFFDAANNSNSSLHDLVASPASASTKANDEYFGEDLILDLHLRVGHHNKRRRLMMSTTTDHQASSSTPIFFTKSTISVDNMIKQPQMFEFVSPSSIIEELDLELRLGQSTPKSQ